MIGKKLVDAYRAAVPAPEVSAHCDGPCGVYDPASARIAAEAVVSMTKKLKAIAAPASGDHAGWLAFHNTTTRYILIKEEQAHIAKNEILVLWTDYFKPEHLQKFPDLHDKIWKATKLCSTCKHEINLDAAEKLLAAIKEIHEIFWATKNRDVAWYVAS